MLKAEVKEGVFQEPCLSWVNWGLILPPLKKCQLRKLIGESDMGLYSHIGQPDSEQYEDK